MSQPLNPDILHWEGRFDRRQYDNETPSHVVCWYGKRMVLAATFDRDVSVALMRAVLARGQNGYAAGPHWVAA